MKQASTYEEINPLIDLCKAGKLFEVQDWISAGKPINSPSLPEKGARKKSPLQVAIDCGFHSLVQVLLERGAAIEEPRYNAMEHSISKRRLDFVELLVEHGADIHSVDMRWVFETWDPRIMEFFIERGADVETGKPLSYALCERIRTALGIFRRYKDRFPSFQEQANIALRHHCREGNIKWVSLMLWAGADPYAKGPDYPYQEPDPEGEMNALEWAAFCGHLEVFQLKSIKLDPGNPNLQGLLREACYGNTSDLMKELLKKGFKPADQKDRGSLLIQRLLTNMDWDYDFDLDFRKKRNIDTSRSREKIKMIHMLAKHGAKWMPDDRVAVNDARRSLLKMAPDYTVEFVWSMSKYKACTRKIIEDLIRTPAIRGLVHEHLPRIHELMEALQPFEGTDKSNKDSQ